MKEKFIVALIVVAIAAVFSSCKDTGVTDQNGSGTNNTSSVVSDNIPNNNTDGEYDDDDNNSDTSSRTLEDDVSSIISSGKDMISSILE